MLRTTKLNSGGSAWSLGKALFGLLAICVAAGLYYAFSGGEPRVAISPAAAGQERAAANNAEPRPGTGTGLPVPRFVSLKSERVNVRRGPSSNHNVAWVFTRKGLPVEVVAEFDHWRRVRDSEGAEGWVYHSLLSGRRTVIAAPWSGKKLIGLRDKASLSSGIVALIAAGAIGQLQSCDGKWCQVDFAGYEGHVAQDRLFGVYPGEVYNQ